MLANNDNFFEAAKRTGKMIKQIGPMQQSLLKDGWEAAKHSKPDLIIFHPKAFGGPHYAEKLDVPVLMMLLVPMMVPTSEYPNIGFPKLKLGRWYNRLTYICVNKLTGLSSAKYVKKWRAEVSLPPLKNVDSLRTPQGKVMPVLHGYSRYVVPQPIDWPETATTTGYWFLDQSDDWTPSIDLQAFLDIGSPPVYIGFGSMAGNNSERLANIVIEAIQQAGVRGIISTGWGGLKAEDLPDTILQIEQAPHEWLFPRMSAVVHHGGAGTTAAALRAGKPNIVVPFFGDQPFWGRQVASLGAGSQPIPQKDLTAERLAFAIKELISDPLIQKNAKKLGENIRKEDGIRTAISIIEQTIKNT